LENTFVLRMMQNNIVKEASPAKYHRDPTPVKIVRLEWVVHAANKS